MFTIKIEFYKKLDLVSRLNIAFFAKYNFFIIITKLTNLYGNKHVKNVYWTVDISRNPDQPERCE